ncbi:questin oxidase family protein [Streptomyces sp. NPDC046215]|uniref:Questin oxidase family protein n=1 Tax=Streptomyces stramineus TaxID=173861 RepID=A0ABN1AAR6_9ACTN
MADINASGTLDEALERLHKTGPELKGGWLSNHAPMAVEALARHGQAPVVHPWVDRYSARLDDLPGTTTRITEKNWREALGDVRRLGDWTAFFARLVAEQPWRDVLARWWPRLLPGIAASATHPAIRVGHAVRTLLTDGETAPRVAELAQALGYWAARHQLLPAPVTPAGALGPAEALAALPPVPDQSGDVLHRLAQLPTAPGWPAASNALRPAAGPEEAHDLLVALVRAATCRYAEYGHGNPVMLVHAATAPNAVLRTLPALPRALWAASATAAWAASAAVMSAYAPAAPMELRPAVPGTAGEAFERAAAHGDAHAIKLTDTALDVLAAAPPGSVHATGALAAVAVSCELIDPA